MSGNYDHVLGFVLEHPWALSESMRGIMAGLLARRIIGQDSNPADVMAAIASRRDSPQPKKGGGVAIIPIHGVISPRMNMLSEFSGGTTFESLTSEFHAAMANPDVKTIVFDVDSPGGNVAGATEFAAEVRKGRAVKPSIAVVQYLGASAAYWAIAGATKIHAAPSALVGSIGVYTMHEDVTEALAQLGVKREVISAGKFKAEAIGGGALSDEARAHVKEHIAGVYARMVGDIALGRDVKKTDITNGYGEGRCVSAADALALGMIDRIATLNDTLAQVMTAPPGAAYSAHHDLSVAATVQEPSQATTQEPLSDIAQQNAYTAALLQLGI